MNDPRAWQKAERILCVRLDSLGDVLMTTPAIRALKEGNSGRNITLLTSRAGANIARLVPEIDDVIVYDPPWMKATSSAEDPGPEFRMIEHIHNLGFDAAVIFTTFSQSPLPAALLLFLAGVPLRLAHCRENPYHLLTHWVREIEHVGTPEIRHEVRRQLDLVASVGYRARDESLSLRVTAEDIEKIQTRLDGSRLDRQRPWLVIHPGASAPSRRYPAAGFARAADLLNSEHGFQIIFTGTAPEVELVESIRSSMREEAFSLAGELGIREFAALIALTPLLITNNTGPVHMAAALNTPVVDLYALTNPQHTPWQVPHRVLYQDVPCKFCYKSLCPMGHHNCLRMVSPDSVVEAALGLLHEVYGSSDARGEKIFLDDSRYSPQK